MPASATLWRYKAERILTFGLVTLVFAFILNRYAATPFHPTVFVWFLVGILIGLVEQAFFRGPLARLPVYLQLILSIAIVAVVSVAIMILLVLLQWLPRPEEGPAIEDVADLWVHPRMLQIMINAQIVTAGVMLFMAMERMVGSRMFRRFLTGRYVHPKREDRIVMFLDLSGSTTLTERLGDRRYFDLLNETFDRMTGPILVSGAEVLKYVGDEVIFTWIAKGGLHDLRCLNLFFDIREGIERDRVHYERTYGVVPRFRAGCHRGVVITSQIGSIKRSIDLSGDAMNTCARLASATKGTGSDLLASEDLLRGAGAAIERFELTGVLPLDLRGKSEAVQVRGVVRIR